MIINLNFIHCKFYKVVKLLTVNGNYSDENGNTIEAPDDLRNVQVDFKGSNNKLIIHPNNKINNTKIVFPADNGVCLIQSGCRFNGSLRISQDCLILLGSGVSCTKPASILAAEKTYIIVGDDAMIASSVVIRSEDAHAIYDVESGKRLNSSKNILIGNHVWIADQAIILSNTFIGDGSVVGAKSLVKGQYPNNSLIVGVPSKAVKNNIAWERPHVALKKPFTKYNAIEQDLIDTPNAWNKTNLNRKQIVIGENALAMLNKYKQLLSYFDFSCICNLEDAKKQYGINSTKLQENFLSKLKKLFSRKK